MKFFRVKYKGRYFKLNINSINFNVFLVPGGFQEDLQQHKVHLPYTNNHSSATTTKWGSESTSEEQQQPRDSQCRNIVLLVVFDRKWIFWSSR